MPDPTRLVVRLPVSLHAHLAALAEREGVSLNTLMVTLLAGGSAFTLDADPVPSELRPWATPTQAKQLAALKRMTDTLVLKLPKN